METVIGIDLGTQGVRAVAVTAAGEMVASAHEKMPMPTGDLPAGWVEQDSIEWWRASASCVRRLMAAMPHEATVAGVAVDSTSGTVLPIDERGDPLHAALMYNDARSGPYVPLVRQAAAELEQRLGYAFNASFALPKILWLLRECPDVCLHTHLFVHAADFITGRLTGDYGVTDYSNALKTGYDLVADEWPSFIERDLGLPLDHLPRVVPPGQLLGHVNARGAQQTGLATGVAVFGGATDGTAAQIASGAVVPGSWNSSLGTTLVIKGITETLLRDPHQRIYSHRHPAGWWMPGGASNTGSEWILREYPAQDIRELDKQAVAVLPTKIVRYPLARVGERFPFVRPQAVGFAVSEPSGLPSTDGGDAVHYAAGLEGTALVERLAYDTLREIGAIVGDRIHVTGGGSNSLVWLRIRASVLGRQLVRPSCSETAMGAALLAATGAWFKTLSAAAGAMVRTDIIVEPERVLTVAYEEKYRFFCEQMKLRGYV